MRLECTRKLLDYLGIKPKKTADDIDPIFTWTANLIIVNRRKTLVIVHVPSRCMFLIYGITAKRIPEIPELIKQGIRELLRSEYVHPEMIEKYFTDGGETLTFAANSSRSTIAHCNKACERVNMFSNLFEPNDMFQHAMLPWLNDDLVGTKDYAYTHEMLVGCLRERYGELVQVCCALELEVQLKLLSPCKRRIIIPDNLNFYQFHRILQGVFEWHDRHLHQFVLERDAQERPIKVVQPSDTAIFSDYYDAETIDSLKVTVRDVFAQHSRIDYEYDFGDDWCHSIKLCQRIENCTEPYPRCIQAVGDAPMEDSGGAYGFAQIREVLKDASHPEYKEISDWVRSTWWSPLDVNRINLRIENVYRRHIPVYHE